MAGQPGTYLPVLPPSSRSGSPDTDTNESELPPDSGADRTPQPRQPFIGPSPRHSPATPPCMYHPISTQKAQPPPHPASGLGPSRTGACAAHPSLAPPTQNRQPQRPSLPYRGRAIPAYRKPVTTRRQRISRLIRNCHPRYAPRDRTHSCTCKADAVSRLCRATSTLEVPTTRATNPADRDWRPWRRCRHHLSRLVRRGSKPG